MYKLLMSILLVFVLSACGTTEQVEPPQEEQPQEEQSQEETGTTTTEWTGEPWTMGDGPPWPQAEDSETINEEGTNHREVFAPRDFDFETPRAEFWVEHPARHAPEGSELAQKRSASRANSEAQGVECQVSYVQVQYSGNDRLDHLMDKGVCWHYNVEVAEERFTAATIGRPDGQRGAMAWYDDEGRLFWYDRYGQTQPTYTEDGPVYWEDTIERDEDEEE